MHQNRRGKEKRDDLDGSEAPAKVSKTEISDAIRKEIIKYGMERWEKHVRYPVKYSLAMLSHDINPKEQFDRTSLEAIVKAQIMTAKDRGKMAEVVEKMAAGSVDSTNSGVLIRVLLECV